MNNLANKQVLMVLTSHDKLGNLDEKTGFWVEEFAAPYYAFIDAGVKVTLASPLGGQPPIDPKSELADFQTAATNRFDNDDAAKNQLANTLVLADLNAGDYDSEYWSQSTDMQANVRHRRPRPTLGFNR